MSRAGRDLAGAVRHCASIGRSTRYSPASGNWLLAVRRPATEGQYDSDAAFKAASERVRAAAADQRLKVLLASASPESFAIADMVDKFPEALLYTDLGVDVIDPEGKIEYGFRMLSWENLDAYPADVILLDQRSGCCLIQWRRR
jgi:hypothetical protein